MDGLGCRWATKRSSAASTWKQTTEFGSYPIPSNTPHTFLSAHTPTQQKTHGTFHSTESESESESDMYMEWALYMKKRLFGKGRMEPTHPHAPDCARLKVLSQHFLDSFIASSDNHNRITMERAKSYIEKWIPTHLINGRTEERLFNGDCLTSLSRNEDCECGGTEMTGLRRRYTGSGSMTGATRTDGYGGTSYGNSGSVPLPVDIQRTTSQVRTNSGN